MPAMWMRTPPGGRRPRSLGMKFFDLLHQLGRDDALGDDALLAVDVGQEHLERLQPLHEPALDARPLAGGDDARHQAHRHDLLGAALVGVDRERHALLDERQLGERLAALRTPRRDSPSSSRVAVRACGRGLPSASMSSS